MRVAIIGAGGAGLTSAKYAKEKGFDCVVYEQWSEVGGVWAYTDYTDFDQYGYPIQNAMYQGLTTNLPKEIMAFQNFPFPKQPRSYLPYQEVQDYIKSYMNHFNLNSMIMLNTVVTLIKPINNSKWEVTSENKITKTTSVEYFDAVMMCTGNCRIPKLPKFPGMDLFKGSQIHSIMYRKPNPYKDQTVLVYGGGISGNDITLNISPFAKKVFFGYRKLIVNRTYPKNVVLKQGEITKFDEDSVHFDDGMNLKIDSIIYTTGYSYKYPMLHKSCGIKDGDAVHPLYKHTININHPTMAFIGLPNFISNFVTFGLQARVFINILLGVANLPSKEDMLADWARDVEDRKSKGLVGSSYHYFHERQSEFYEDLSRLGKTESIPKVVTYIYKAAANKALNGAENYQDDYYEIIDDTNFTVRINSKI